MSDAEMWMVVITAGAAIVPWAFSIHAKVAVIADTVQRMPEMFDELKATLADHEARLDAHDAEIKTLKNKAAPSN
ncbi:MAG: hypothetical protein EBT15_07265 [Betaproteobacteria bacterium]|nr:hypothetical protein [Betaproteobacteria bacterium]